MTDRFLPVSLRIREGDPCLVVGGGEVALSKVVWLLEFKLDVELVALRLCSGLKALVDGKRILWQPRQYDGMDIRGRPLVIAATDDAAVNALVHDDALRAGIPVNVVDQPELCTFYVPATVRRGDLSVANGTAGRSPALCARLRREFSQELPRWFGTYVAMLGDIREQIRDLLPDRTERSRVLAYLASRDGQNQLLRCGSDDERREVLDRLMEKRVRTVLAEESTQGGMVYLVGAGPGDPGLVTERAFTCIRMADVVVFDGLVNPAILDHARPDASLVDAAKRSDCKRFSQDEINDMLVELAKSGKRVCRLKGGDPFVFGRGGGRGDAPEEQWRSFQCRAGDHISSCRTLICGDSDYPSGTRLLLSGDYRSRGSGEDRQPRQLEGCGLQ